MWRRNIDTILGMTKRTKDGKVPFVYQEVIESQGEPIKASDYAFAGRVTEFKYGMFMKSINTQKDQL